MAGLILQLAGIATVVNGLHERQRQFEIEGFWRGSVRTLSKVWPFRRRVDAVAHVLVASGGAFAVGSINARLLPASPTLEERVTAIEQRQDDLSSEIEQTSLRISQETTALRGTIDTERNDRLTQAAAMKDDLKNAVAGTLHLDWIGIVLLVLGIVLATISPEIVWLANLMRSHFQ